jgi:hypothetical protein
MSARLSHYIIYLSLFNWISGAAALSQCDTCAPLSQFSALHGRLNKYYLCGIGQEGTMECVLVPANFFCSKL